MKTVALQQTVVAMQGMARVSRSCHLSQCKTFVATRIPTRVAPQNRMDAIRTMALFGAAASKTSDSIYDIEVETIDGRKVSMKSFKGKVLLIVNLASQCGFTPQYAELVELYKKYKSQGLEIIGQPCSQFGNQEPGSNKEIKSFAERNYGATFPLLAKGNVNGSDELPLWSYLKSKKGGILGDDIKWNFSKFTVARDGTVVSRHPSTTSPLALEEEIKKLL